MARKVITIILITFTLVLTFLVVSLNTLIDKNRYHIQEEIQKALGRSLTFDQLQLSLWGGLGLAAKNLRIAEDPRFAATPFIQAKELTMQVRWLPLLTGNIEIKTFILNEPEIQIIKNEARSLNISALTGSNKVTKKTRAEKGKKRRSVPILLASAINVTNGKIYYIDRSVKEPVEVRIRNLDLELSGLALKGTSRVKLAANLFAGQGQNIRLEGRIGRFGDGRDWTRYPLNLQVQIDPLLLRQLTRTIPFLREKIPRYLGITGSLMFKARLLGTLERPRIKDLTLTGPFFGSTESNVAAEGELDFSKGGSWTEAEIKGNIIADPVSLRGLKKIPSLRRVLPASLVSQGSLGVVSELEGRLEDLRIHAVIKAAGSEIRYGNWLRKAKGIPAEMEVNARRKKDRIIFEKSVVTLHNLKLKFSGLLEELPERRLMLKLRSDEMDLSGWDRLLLPLSSYGIGGKLQWDLSIKKILGFRDDGLDIRGAVDLNEILAKDRKSGRSIEKLTARLFFRGKEARVERASLRLGSSNLSFEATLPDLFRPILHYTLRSPQLKLADLTDLPAYKADGMKGLLSAGELQVEKGKPLIQGSLSSSQGTLQGIPYRNLGGEFVRFPGGLTFENLSFQALKGTLLADGAWEAAVESSQRLTLDVKIEAVDLRSLLSQKLPKFKDHIEGRLNFKGRLRGSGKNGSALQAKLQGEGKTEVLGGSLKDFNLVEQVLSKVTGLPGISNLVSSRLPSRTSMLFKRRDTPFDTLAATFTVQQGRIHTKDLFLATPDYNISGEGWVGLDKTMKWKATLVLSPQLTQELIEEHKNIRYIVDRQGRLAIPFRLEGALPNVKAKPDLKGFVEAIQKGLLQRGIERALGREKDGKKKKRQDWIRKGLEQLFKK